MSLFFVLVKVDFKCHCRVLKFSVAYVVLYSMSFEEWSFLNDVVFRPDYLSLVPALADATLSRTYLSYA